MNMDVHAPIIVPREVLVAAGILIGFSIACAAIGHLAGVAKPAMEMHGAPVLARSLRFVDRPDGTLVVVDADRSAVVRVVAPDAEGFMRTTMQGLAGLRKRAGGSPDAVLRLAEWRDGRLTLDDPASGTRLDLEAFGPTNEGAFKRLLRPESGP